MVPSAFVVLECLPRTSNGKVDRSKLPAPSVVETPNEPVWRENLTERRVAAIWAEVLGTAVDPGDLTFFEMGGHSLLATRAVLRCRKTFSVELPLDALFDYPTVTRLAERIEQLHGGIRRFDSRPPRRVPRTNFLPLSFAQQRLWIAQSLNPASELFNVPLALRFRGPLNVPALRLSLEQLVSRHEVLRTSFAEEDGNVAQEIHASGIFELTRCNLLPKPGQTREAALEFAAQQESSKPFDLTREVPFRATLIDTDEDDHLLVLVMHHIATDGWSANVLIRELCALYAAELECRPAALPELTIQYVDYAVWQREVLQGEKT